MAGRWVRIAALVAAASLGAFLAGCGTPSWAHALMECERYRSGELLAESTHYSVCATACASTDEYSDVGGHRTRWIEAYCSPEDLQADLARWCEADRADWESDRRAYGALGDYAAPAECREYFAIRLLSQGAGRLGGDEPEPSRGPGGSVEVGSDPEGEVLRGPADATDSRRQRKPSLQDHDAEEQHSADADRERKSKNRSSSSGGDGPSSSEPKATDPAQPTKEPPPPDDPPPSDDPPQDKPPSPDDAPPPKEPPLQVDEGAG